jgi:hypothetical protein
MQLRGGYIMNLSIEEKAIAMNLAMNIELGNVDLDVLVDVFAEYFNDAAQIISFWKTLTDQSPMIKNVLNIISEKFTLEMNRHKLEEIYLKS